MQTTWIKHPLAVFTANDQDASNGIVIGGGQILELVASGQAPTIQVDQVFDASEHVLLPGLINTHHHLYQTLTRAYPPALNKRLFPWLKTLYPVWARLQPEMLFNATRLGLVELLLSGCTTVADHHYLFPQALTEAIDIQVQAATETGSRVVLTRGAMSLGEEQGGLPPQSTVQTDREILDDSARVIKAFHESGEGARIQIALAPCSPFSVTRELMVETASLARSHQVRLHTHLAETEDENQFCLSMFGVRPVDYLESVDWLSSDVWLAHGIHFNDEELIRLGQAGVGVCHCPSSNMVLASGICRTLEFQNAGGHVGLGVDGSASNDASNMMQEVRQALLINRLRYQADEVTHRDALYWATKGSANVLGRTDIGELALAKQADLALFKLDEPRFSGAHDPLAALVLCGAASADHVAIAGEWRVRDGLPVHQDLPELIQQHTASARQLVS
ncbi:hydroxydechloroatrazine ethylaminohydrolase [Oleiphilus messinensis]|uniref:Hydroxydechloroatrazine ethylaminohydrolase n=1 Tax=Oleiphilus messinensis TaxID=141451 RepID=A0A1Y0IB12_9GAMM|nr:8-oxoguanine deaminase [Oleiphilus messinensis]ARU57722.1 hydroxydechloroatrazine ethylaminohydrolase [Oleiphilus messinensis]